MNYPELIKLAHERVRDDSIEVPYLSAFEGQSTYTVTEDHAPSGSVGDRLLRFVVDHRGVRPRFFAAESRGVLCWKNPRFDSPGLIQWADGVLEQFAAGRTAGELEWESYVWVSPNWRVRF